MEYHINGGEKLIIENNTKYRGFAMLYMVILITIIFVVAVGSVVVMNNVRNGSINKRDLTVDTTNTTTGDEIPTNKPSQSKSKDSVATLNWQPTGDGWQATTAPAPCPNPLTFEPPADMTKVTSVLYPGQTRGGNYKPHGGFRFDNLTDNNLTVTAPITAYAVQGARYLEKDELQYTFDFIHPCGYMYRVGHLFKLPANLAKIAETFLAAAEGDSRTQFIDPPVLVNKGDVLATAVGMIKGSNVFFDFGVYDLNNKNKASENAVWAAAHDPQLAGRAVCWFDLLPADAEAIVRSLPAGDPESGKKSDYCP